MPVPVVVKVLTLPYSLRPRYLTDVMAQEGRTFDLVLDTSGSNGFQTIR